ncbi:ATP-grasp domain-containing protein [Phytoactinopolyspora alkaliphila]|uniref:ATP-grasp domain-containing protein n=1 Tax=Phytoactinopolyspora alkaliphila TaxID=1783498 RepID=A0A6N9YQC2_9ACTN|nr:ATP-grasp domain-containing protein [Phytoactinopolyspora alkaliphila]NED97147.1 ATP-grasp domain-containing protein [Phytoactinopolyspora alkaliphila]
MPPLTQHHGAGSGPSAAPADVESLINAALAKLEHLQPRSYELEHKVGKRALDAAMLRSAADRRGLESIRISPQTQIIRHGDLAVGFFQNMSSRLTGLDRIVTNNKLITKRILVDQGLPVARGEVVDCLDGALESFRRVGAPAVVKPINGSGGRGVTVDIRDDAELKPAAEEAFAMARRVLVEEMVAGIDLRIMTIAGRAVAAMLRVPANVVGDGTSSIRQLIERKNEVRAGNAYLRHCPIQINPFTEHHLELRGMTPDSVPEAGQRVFLHFKANLSSGGDSYELVDVVHPGILRLAERAAACLPSAYHAGIDILLERFDAPPEEQRCIVCEVNLNNEMPIHIFPLFGEPVDTGDEAVEGYFFRAGDDLRASPFRLDPTPAAEQRIAVSAPAPEKLVDQAASSSEISGTPWPGDAARAGSPRGLDQRELRPRLLRGGFDDVQYQGKLVYARRGDREEIFERSGRTMFADAASTASAVLRGLLRAAGLPALVRQRFDTATLHDVRALVSEHPGPWRMRARRDTQGDARTIRFTTAADLDQAWSRLPQGTTAVTVQQAPAGAECKLLLAGGELVSSVVISPPVVTGDGTSSLGELIDQKLAGRAAHPYLRHFPVKASLLSEDGLARKGLRKDDVPAAGTVIRLARTPLMSVGADTFGFSGCPYPELAPAARVLLGFIGTVPLAAVTFAVQAPATPGESQTWAVSGFDTDPILAEFAYPGYGSAGPAYDAAAEQLLGCQRYVLPIEGRPAQ